MRGKRGNSKRGIALDWRFDIALVLLLVAGIGLLLRTCSRLELSGDALYDDYARLYNKQYNAAYPNEVILQLEQRFFHGTSIRDVDMSQVREWEDRYRNDPRYWQLRRDCSVDGAAINSVYDDSIRRGICDEASFFYAAWDLDHSSTSLSEHECYDAAIALNPDNAYYYYMKAYYYIYKQQYQSSWEMLKAGNAAKECYTPHPFPYGYIVDNYNPSNLNINKFIATRTALYTALPNSNDAKDSLKKLVDKPREVISNQYLDDLAWAELRLLQTEDSVMILQLIHSSFYRETVCAIADKRMQFNPEQAREFAYIKQTMREYKQLHARVNEADFNNETRSALVSAYFGLGQELTNCRSFAALTNGWPRHPLTAWANGELAGYPIPEDFEPLPKYLPKTD
jgi:hypothetical protein